MKKPAFTTLKLTDIGTEMASVFPKEVVAKLGIRAGNTRYATAMQKAIC